MLGWLKKYFIPHEENDRKPHMLRSEATFFFVLLTLGVEVYFFAQALLVIPHNGLFAFIFPDVLVDQTNANRVAMNVPPLKPNALLALAASEKANDMATKGYFAHTSPSGLTPWYWFSEVGYDFTYAGENLAVDFTDSSDVTNAWMNSPGHRANILNNNFTEIGIATASGTYQGHNAVFVVELFGRPVPSFSPIAPIANAETPPPDLMKSKTASVPIPAPKPKPAIAPPAPAPSPVVMSEESTTAAGEQDLFVAVKSADVGPGVAAAAVSGTISELQTAGAMTAESNWLEQLLASPRTVADYALGMLGLVMLAALGTSLYHKLHLSEPRLVWNGAVILLLVVSTLALNYYFSLSYLRIM